MVQTNYKEPPTTLVFLLLNLVKVLNNCSLSVYIYIYKYDQEDTLSGDASTVDKATKKNLRNLVKVGEKLLEKQVTRMNPDTGVYEPVLNAGTNMESLQKYSSLSIYIYIYTPTYLSI